MTIVDKHNTVKSAKYIEVTESSEEVAKLKVTVKLVSDKISFLEEPNRLILPILEKILLLKQIEDISDTQNLEHSQRL